MIDKESEMQVDSLPISALNGQEFDILSTDNLYEVPIRSIFDCSKCELTFEEKSKYLGHMLEVHQNTTRMYTLDKSAGSGLVIDDDEKYKSKEKSTYESQAGVHLNNKAKMFKESPIQITDQKSSESPLNNKLQSRASMSDALEQIAPIGQPRICSSSNNLNTDISATSSYCEQILGYHLTEMGNGIAAAALAQKFRLFDGHITADENIIRIDGDSDIGNDNIACTFLNRSKPGEFKNCCSSEQGNCGIDHVNSNKLIAGVKMGVIDSAVLSVQSLHCNPAADPISYKVMKYVLVYVVQ